MTSTLKRILNLYQLCGQKGVVHQYLDKSVTVLGASTRYDCTFRNSFKAFLDDGCTWYTRLCASPYACAHRAGRGSATSDKQRTESSISGPRAISGDYTVDKWPTEGYNCPPAMTAIVRVPCPLRSLNFPLVRRLTV